MNIQSSTPAEASIHFTKILQACAEVHTGHENIHLLSIQYTPAVICAEDAKWVSPDSTMLFTDYYDIDFSVREGSRAYEIRASITTSVLDDPNYDVSAEFLIIVRDAVLDIESRPDC